MILPKPLDVAEAAVRIAPYVIHTPLLNVPALDAILGGKILIKAECLQRTGSFKLRGAYSSLLRMSDEERRNGVVAGSAGNHGQALAFAGRELGTKVTIVMPSDAPRAKIEATRRWGAEIKFYDRLTQHRDSLVEELAAATGATHVHPFDNIDVIAGQGTTALEIFSDAVTMGLKPTALFCPTGGGGLAAGCALAADYLGERIAIHSCEPQGFDDTARSLAAGQLVRNDMTASTLCDALVTPTPGTLTFAINRSRLAAGLSVDDARVRDAILIGLNEIKLLIEPGGVTGLAAAIKHPELVEGKTVAILVTGGNMDLSTIFNDAEVNYRRNG